MNYFSINHITAANTVLKAILTNQNAFRIFLNSISISNLFEFYKEIRQYAFIIKTITNVVTLGI